MPRSAKLEDAERAPVHTENVEEISFVIGQRNRGHRFSLVRLPDGLAVTAGNWNDVWAACPEFGVPWRNVVFENDTVRDEVLQAWGPHPGMPVG